jgi:AraC-like DNA-binding protein/ligand-binding sensor protein
MNLDTLDSVGSRNQTAEICQRAVSTTRCGTLSVHKPRSSGDSAADLEASQRPRAPERAEDVDASRMRHEDLDLLRAIAASHVFTEFERAFKEVTGLPLTLRPLGSLQLSFQCRKEQAPFCALMSRENRSCAACLQSQSQIADAAGEQPHTGLCHAGLCETAVPLRLGNRSIGFLWTGQVFLRKPSESQFRRTLNVLAGRGMNVDQSTLRGAYFEMRLVPREQHAAAVKLLTIFAKHLEMLSNQIVIQRENAEPATITRAKNFIREHHAEDLSLLQVAQSAHMSPFYFCKLFKRTTGLTFTNFLSRVRIEKSKNLLINPRLRVSEVAYEVGFQSLTHFNRTFQKMLGQSPTQYRQKMHVAKK